MGMIDFLINAGAAILTGGKSESDEISKLLKSGLGDKIKNLKVDFNDGIVTLSGECDSHATKEKTVLLAGNIKGVKKVNFDALTSPKPVEDTEYYTVKKGDSLSKIAKSYYGDAMKYPVIFEANREVIKDADLIYPGQVLRIPKATK